MNQDPLTRASHRDPPPPLRGLWCGLERVYVPVHTHGQETQSSMMNVGDSQLRSWGEAGQDTMQVGLGCDYVPAKLGSQAWQERVTPGPGIAVAILGG